MPTRNFDTLVQRLVTNVPGCPFPVIEKYIRDAAIEVCEETLAWKYQQPPIRLTPGLHNYPYEPPNNAEVHAFIHVALNGTKIIPCTFEDIYDQYPDWPNHDPEHLSRPQFIVHLDADQFGMAPVPDDEENYDLSMMVALKPLRTAAGMDESVFDEIENAVMDGALGYLYMLPDKSWTDMKLAEFHKRQFSYRNAGRRARQNLGNGRASVAVRPRPWV